MTEKHVRIRRGNKEDALRVRNELVGIAMDIFKSQGIEGVSMRAVAAKAGMSPMSPYRYFANRQALLKYLWFQSIHDLKEYLHESITEIQSARKRHRVLIRAFINYWIEHPERFWLAYEAQGDRGALSPFSIPESHTDSYQAALKLLRTTAVEVAHEIGVSDKEAILASDLCMVMMQGYLNAYLVNTRYPWVDKQKLKEIFIEQTALSVERFLIEADQASG
ncbi:MAG: hypothetical protein B7X12_00750 [Halothiobacillus sp. 20-53-49]|jgi:AcrR family transcriptional regulator|uniref:TetR/AcrR family transcriptional regulator n=1 Tax=Halothiobacillus sp. 15-55-196 TaxID=1970382 RepID=UPI000BD97F40|nr:TetR/AcrR family transcriptional regulator [Halothiobacillus sp. 15-55-196]OYV47449.1 MAG: hypothetical protein B7X12_00750 [Halothiobacillus sp. 20-53-49]OZB37304.1 MAG: hypothetical protein B7X44_02685 [Halothiobacillus sp. 15-55-196]HUN00787.1 TetR/AcrR family transcriptional regulator [Halothiobacillus sp.]